MFTLVAKSISLLRPIKKKIVLTCGNFDGSAEISTRSPKLYQRPKNIKQPVTNKLTEVLKLHQLTCGFYKTDDGEIQKFKTNPKLNELMSILEETEDKCIIWANYVFNIKMIKQKLEETYGKDSVVSIYGEDSVQVRNDAVESFQHDDRCRFIVGNPTVGGYGLTLTAARYVIYYSNILL